MEETYEEWKKRVMAKYKDEPKFDENEYLEQYFLSQSGITYLKPGTIIPMKHKPARK